MPTDAKSSAAWCRPLLRSFVCKVCNEDETAAVRNWQGYINAQIDARCHTSDPPDRSTLIGCSASVTMPRVKHERRDSANPVVYFDVAVNGGATGTHDLGRVVFELYNDIAPKVFIVHMFS